MIRFESSNSIEYPNWSKGAYIVIVLWQKIKNAAVGTFSRVADATRDGVAQVTGSQTVDRSVLTMKKALEDVMLSM